MRWRLYRTKTTGFVWTSKQNEGQVRQVWKNKQQKLLFQI